MKVITVATEDVATKYHVFAYTLIRSRSLQYILMYSTARYHVLHALSVGLVRLVHSTARR